MAPRDPQGAALAAQAARLFFDRQLSKVDIAKRLGISRFRVARLIDLALESGLVRIEFRDVPAVDRACARAIEDRFGIDLCAVAAAGPGATPGALPRLAAEMVAEMIGEGDVVGIAWGSTLAALVAELPVRSDPSARVVQLAGSSTRVNREQTPGELARRLAERLGAEYRPLLAPAFVESAELRNALRLEPEIAAAMADYGRVRLAIVGVGAFPTGDGPVRSSLVESGVLAEPDLAEMHATGAVGDLVLYPFDDAGRFVAPGLSERAIAIGVEQLRAVPMVVAVAGGAAKARAIAGALATGVVDVLITDQAAAEVLAGAGPAASPEAP